MIPANRQHILLRNLRHQTGHLNQSSFFHILTKYFNKAYLISSTAQRPCWARPPHYWGFTITLIQQSVRLLWMSDRPDAETSIWKHTTLTRDRHPCPRLESNPKYQQVRGRRHTAYTTRPLGSAFTIIHPPNSIAPNKFLLAYFPLNFPQTFLILSLTLCATSSHHSPYNN